MGEVPNEADATQNYETDVELLLAASKAIQQMVAERQVLRERVMTLEHELQALRSQAILVNDSYRKLTGEFVTQFKLIDSAVSNLFRERGSSEASPAEGVTPQTPCATQSTAAA